MWERPGWVSHYALEPGDWPDVLRLVREALGSGPLTRDELAAALDADRRFGHLGAHVRRGGGGDALLKAMGWQGALCFAPSRGRTTTFRSPEGLPGWRGVWDVAEAGPHVIGTYLSACGPATPEHLRYWIGAGLGAGRGLRAWLRDLLATGDLAEVDVDGAPALVRAEHVDDLAGTSADAAPAVVLLPGSDLWVLGPGTDDARVVLPAHRAHLTRGENPVLVRGVVAGTWRRPARDAAPTLTWFEGSQHQPVPAADLDAELERTARLLGPTA